MQPNSSLYVRRLHCSCPGQGGEEANMESESTTGLYREPQLAKMLKC